MRLGYPVYTEEKPPADSAPEALAVARVAKETTACFAPRHSRSATITPTPREGMDRRTFRRMICYSLSIDYCSGRYENKTPLQQLFLLDFALHYHRSHPEFLFGDVESVFTAFTKDHHAYGISLRFMVNNGAVGTLNLNDGRTLDIPTEEVEITMNGGNFMTIHNSSTWRITENVEERSKVARTLPLLFRAGTGGRWATGHLAEMKTS